MKKKKMSSKAVLGVVLLQGAVLGAVGLALALYFNLIGDDALGLNLPVVYWSLGLTGFLIALAVGSRFAFPRFVAELDADVVNLWQSTGVVLTPVTIVLISLSAGIGEEFLFRAAVQGYLSTLMPAGFAIAIASLIFGAVHAASKRYFLVAFIISALLGLAYHWSGSLLVVIAAHTLYDIWALHRFKTLLHESDLTP